MGFEPSLRQDIQKIRRINGRYREFKELNNSQQLTFIKPFRNFFGRMCNNFGFEPLTKKTLKIMTLQEAYNFFESLKTETTKKYEIKVYEKFLHMLTELKIREFSKDEIQSIETELDRLNLKSNPENRKKYFKKAHSKFEKYLKETFSLTTKEYYQKLYGGLGLLFGLLFGVVFLSSLERSLGISLGLIGGMVVGSLIGRHMDTQAKTAGNII